MPMALLDVLFYCFLSHADILSMAIVPHLFLNLIVTTKEKWEVEDSSCTPNGCGRLLVVGGPTLLTGREIP